jgi:hypothetical protein
VLRGDPDGSANAYAWTYSWNGGELLVSSRLVEELNEDQLRTVILHELGHIKEHHYWLGLVPSALEAALVGAALPVVFWVERTIDSVAIRWLLTSIGLLLWGSLIVARRSLSIRQELRADAFAAARVGPEMAAETLRRTTQLTHDPFRVDPGLELALGHASLATRLAHLEGAPTRDLRPGDSGSQRSTARFSRTVSRFRDEQLQEFAKHLEARYEKAFREHDAMLRVFPVRIPHPWMVGEGAQVSLIPIQSYALHWESDLSSQIEIARRRRLTREWHPILTSDEVEAWLASKTRTYLARIVPAETTE